MRVTLKNLFVWGSGAVFIFTVAGYSYYQSRALLEGPRIMLDGPENGSSTTTPLIDIAGETRNVKEITLDGRQIFIDLEGRFSEKLLLSRGYNMIVLTAKDFEGRDIREEREIILKEERLVEMPM